MTVQILKSQIKDEAAFRDALEQLCLAKIQHMMHGEVGTSPPSHPVLDQLIKRTPTGPDTPDSIAIIDFEIVNDDPPPPTPEELKAKAIHELRLQEQAEIEAILPQNKRRLFEMNAQRLQTRLLLEQSNGKTEMSAEDEKAVEEIKTINEAIADIQYAYAKREAEL